MLFCAGGRGKALKSVMLEVEERKGGRLEVCVVPGAEALDPSRSRWGCAAYSFSSAPQQPGPILRTCRLPHVSHSLPLTQIVSNSKFLFGSCKVIQLLPRGSCGPQIPSDTHLCLRSEGSLLSLEAPQSTGVARRAMCAVLRVCRYPFPSWSASCRRTSRRWRTWVPKARRGAGQGGASGI